MPLTRDAADVAPGDLAHELLDPARLELARGGVAEPSGCLRAQRLRSRRRCRSCRSRCASRSSSDAAARGGASSSRRTSSSFFMSLREAHAGVAHGAVEQLAPEVHALLRAARRAGSRGCGCARGWWRRSRASPCSGCWFGMVITSITSPFSHLVAERDDRAVGARAGAVVADLACGSRRRSRWASSRAGTCARRPWA